MHPDRRSPLSTHSGNGTRCASNVFCVLVVHVVGNLALHFLTIAVDESDRLSHGDSDVPEVGSCPRLPRPTRWNLRSGLRSPFRQGANRLDLRSEIALLLVLTACLWLWSFSLAVGYALLLWLTSIIHCLVNIQPAPAPGRPP